MVFLKEIFETVDFENNQETKKKTYISPVKELRMTVSRLNVCPLRVHLFIAQVYGIT